MHPDENPNIHDILKKHKINYLNSQIQPVAMELVLELYANTYRPLTEDTPAKPELIFWNTASRTRWPYRAMLDRLTLQGCDWKPASTFIPRKIEVVDLDFIPKAWTYFLYHTLDTNRSGSELITTRAQALYLLLTRQLVNIERIIYADMGEMDQSIPKTYLGHAFVILLLCRKVGVEDFTDGRILNSTRALDAAWIVTPYFPKHKYTKIRVFIKTKK
ncbi:hypothetical protein KIW84_012009 [Lathyrus oleraceus]|uniref:Putative plant transposon protein domain-containing protein n=1 Tax=Pisum sativum TaxID=3888 RepID=A0A9D5GW21_PEA|nr:hypothetical protein KIW84_012009 [Pisum sativum]